MCPSAVLSHLPLAVLAFAVSVPTTALMLPFPDSALSQERDEVRLASDEPQPEGGRPEEYIVSTTYSVSSNGKRSPDGKQRKHEKDQRGKGRKHTGRQPSTRATFQTRRDGVTVKLEPQLGISDYGVFEDVRGRVYSWTGSPSSKVQRMRIGGALLGANRCRDVYGADPKQTEQIFQRTHYGYSPWTDYYRGTNDCWVQTGHNYFKITLPNGKLWDDFVIGDTEQDM